MPKLQRGKSIWSAPVYVARFADGTEARMSFWSMVGKPLDFDRGRRMCCGVIGDERGRAGGAASCTRPFAAPATDIVHGEVEWGGEVFIDPAFSAKPVAPAPAPKLDAVAKILAQIAKLPPADRQRLELSLLS